MPRCATSSRPGLAATAPVNAPFSCPNSSLSSSSFESVGAVQVHERLVGARSVAVQPAREHALAGAGLALDQAPGFPPRRTRRASSARLRIAGLVPTKGSSRRGAPRATGSRAGAAGCAGSRAARSSIDQQRGQLHRLGQEMLGPFLDRPHRQVDRAVSGEDDDRQPSVSEALQPRQQLERRCRPAASSRGCRVRAAVLRNAASAGLAGPGLLDRAVPSISRKSPIAEAHGRLVVDDQDPLRRGIRRPSFRSRRASARGQRTVTSAPPSGWFAAASRAAVLLHDALHDRQPEPGPAAPPREERLEHARQVLGLRSPVPRPSR